MAAWISDPLSRTRCNVEENSVRGRRLMWKLHDHMCRDTICLIGFLKVSSCLLPQGAEMREGLMHRALSLHENFLWLHYISNFSGWTGSGFRRYILRKAENLLRNIHFVIPWHLNFVKPAPGGLLTLKPPGLGLGSSPLSFPKCSRPSVAYSRDALTIQHDFWQVKKKSP